MQADFPFLFSSSDKQLTGANRVLKKVGSGEKGGDLRDCIKFALF